MKQVSLKRLRGAYLTLAAAAAALLIGAPTYAGEHRFGVIVGDQVQVESSAIPHFRCESRPFDLSQGLYCYDPLAIRAAYGVNSLINNGATGAGQTIVILDAFGSPTIQSDLQDFDSLFGIPAPPSFQIITMPGTPPFDPNDANIVGWTAEIALDVQWSHAMAPGASIVLVAAASNSDADLIAGLNFALDNHLGNVVSMSFGESEIGLANPAGLDIIAAWTAAFKKARLNHVTLFVSTGDQGVDTQTFFTPSASFPSTSPLVSAVGGTNLRFGTATNAAFNGSYQFEQVWDDPADCNNLCLFGAGGGGMSFLLPQPHYQNNNVPNAVNKTLHGHRGVPDLAYNAGVAGGVLAHWGVGAPGATSFFLFGGTSAGAPQWAGIIADINSALGHPVGFINPWLYRLGGQGQLSSLFHDVTIGNNGFDGVPGYPATPGYDLSTGWGTPNFVKLGAMLSNPPTDSDPSSDP
jgi:subtilase family serine protease